MLAPQTTTGGMLAATPQTGGVLGASASQPVPKDREGGMLMNKPQQQTATPPDIQAWLNEQRRKKEGQRGYLAG